MTIVLFVEGDEREAAEPHDLCLICSNGGEDHCLAYNVELLDEETEVRITANQRMLFEGIVEEPNSTVAKLLMTYRDLN